MLIVIRSVQDLLFGQLMGVYEQSNKETGRRRWPQESVGRQLALAEQDHFDYLRHCFFTLPGAAVCVWQMDGRYVSALRLEPWKDGMLISGLETAPYLRGKGYAFALLAAVQEQLNREKPVRLYSHIHKGNAASIHIHKQCGFQQIYDYAVLLDGSVDPHYGTYCHSY